MDLRLTPEQQSLRESLRRLLDRRLADLVEALPAPPRHDPAQAADDVRAIGLVGLGLPEDVNGAGAFTDLVMAHEELGHGLAAPLIPTLTLAGRLALHTAPSPARDRLLGELADGSLLAAPAVAESADLDADPATTATPDGDGVRVDGRKQWVVAGRDVAELLVVARESTGGGHVVARIPVDASGVEWSAAQTASDITHWSVTLRGVVVAAEHVLALGDDQSLLRYRNESAVLAAARLVGAGRAVLERSVEHVRTREQFGRPIGTFQAVQHQLADVATDLDATSLAVGQAAWAVEAGAAPEETRRMAAIALLAARTAARRATLVAHQLHGGMGFVLDSPLHLWSARAVADPSIPVDRRHLLDQLSDALGITADSIALPPDHRAAAVS